MADQIFQTLCAALDARKWNYEADVAKRAIRCRVNGKDIPIDMNIRINEQRKLIEFYSQLPCIMPEDKRIEGAIAVSVANYGLYDGSIIYGIDKGILLYRMTCSYHDGVIGEGLFHYMIQCGCVNVDLYNDRFAALAEGKIDIQQFIALE